MRKLVKWCKEEFKSVLPAIIYFCIAFNLIHFTEALGLRAYGIHYYSYLSVTFAALLVGKALIIINTFPFINLFPNRPLIYNIVWKFFIYNFFMLLFRILEALLDLYLHSHHFQEAYDVMMTRLASPVFWAVQMLFVIVFLVYIVASEFIRELGVDNVYRMLFGEKQPCV